ncbi:MAG TPA: VF530 family protein [Geopsychrobacteraceae bacterium]|nr:VF530 family protein [Geopsychrobacteraceae bacterium]
MAERIRNKMTEQQSNDPLHGVTLKQIVTGLVEYYGWQELGQNIEIRCFTSNPSINSSLKFLRRTPWARKKVEALYLAMKRIDW